MKQDVIRKAVLQIVDKYPIRRVVLFGSQADGTARADSDVDLIIEFSNSVTLITLSQITQTLEEILHTSVDVIHGPLRDEDLLETGVEVEIYAA